MADQSATLGVLSGNELMDYLKTLSATQLTELTARAGEDVLEAMNTFVQRLMGECWTAVGGQRAQHVPACPRSESVWWGVV